MSMKKNRDGSKLRRSTFTWSHLLGLALMLSVQPLTAQAQGLGIPKSERTAAEHKMDSRLIDLSRAASGGALKSDALQELPLAARELAASELASDNSISVVIKGPVSGALTAFIKELGGTEVREFPRFNTTTARLPLSALSAVAGRPEVRSVVPKETPITNRYKPTADQQRTLLKNAYNTKIGPVTWQGVQAHKADAAHTAGYKGAGSKICVLSDGVTSLATSQTAGELPTVTVLPGQAGSGDEGTAMLEIIHDMAPDATLGFATAFNGEVEMAQNILDLQTSGCSIIVDDVTYLTAGAFQEGPIAQAVSIVSAAGAMYFSSAANSGNLTHATSGTYESDFVDSVLSVPASITAALGNNIKLHAFGANNYTTLTTATNVITLKWSDALGGSSNDYALVLTTPTNTVLGVSDNTQNGTQDPVEGLQAQSGYVIPAGTRIYVVRNASAAPRAIRLDTNRGRITPADGTAGNTYGHNAARDGISVGAVSLAKASGPGGIFTGGGANPVNDYSSDGPRKLFYEQNGTPITPGNLLFGSSGGITLLKVDIAAADCGNTSVAGFKTFCGTSAAAPTAAAIAALFKSANPTATNSQILSMMKSTALDVEAAGMDRDSGAGLLMLPTSMVMAYTVTGSAASSGGTGTVVCQAAPVLQGERATCSLTPSNVSSAVGAITDTCGPGGSLFGTTYTTGPVSANCTVSASFRQVISGPTQTGTGVATATLTGGAASCQFTSANFVGAPATPPAGVNFPQGFFAFTADQCQAASGAVTVTITYPNPIPPGAQYYKYGKEKGSTNPNDHWYTIPITVNGNQISFTIQDGERGDSDLIANGTIVDPGGLGISVASAAAIPTLSEYAMLALIGLLALTAGVSRQHRTH